VGLRLTWDDRSTDVHELTTVIDTSDVWPAVCDERDSTAPIRADGYIDVDGRLKSVIIRGGENISPAEVEAVLERHPDVRYAGFRWREASGSSGWTRDKGQTSPDVVRAS